MQKKIKVYSKALQDIASGVAYYQLQQKGLGKRFENSVHHTFKKIQKFPFAASFAYENIRYKLVAHFPYIILYEFDESTIYVLRVFNTYQQPVY